MYQERFETTVEHLDVFSCLNCRETTNIRMIHDKDTETIECRKCGVSIRGRQAWAVVAKWNWSFVERYSEISGAERDLYENLWKEAVHSEVAAEMRHERQDKLNSLILSRCPVRRGDVVEYNSFPTGPFVVMSVEAIWAYNTGPIWIAKLSNLGKYFKGEGSNHELWENSDREYAVNSAFVRPYKWNHIQSGMTCESSGRAGTLKKTEDRKAKYFVESEDGSLSAVRTLSDIRVRLDQILRRTKEFS